MRGKLRCALPAGLLAVLVTAACSGHRTVSVKRAEPVGDVELAPAEGLSARLASADSAARVPQIGQCPQDLVDPASGTRLRKVRSFSQSRRETRGDTVFELVQAYGDYITPPDQPEDAATTTVVRVDCADLHVLGLPGNG